MSHEWTPGWPNVPGPKPGDPPSLPWHPWQERLRIPHIEFASSIHCSLNPKDGEKSRTINTDKAAAYTVAISALKAEGQCPADTAHRQVKYLNNLIEADHGKLKRLIKPTLGFKTMKTAYATLKGFEVMRALRKGQATPWCYETGILGEIRLIHRNFGLYAA